MNEDLFRDGIISLNTRQFGTVVELIVKLLKDYQESNQLDFDLFDPETKRSIEVKSSRVFRKQSLKFNLDNLYDLIIKSSNRNRLLRQLFAIFFCEFPECDIFALRMQGNSGKLLIPTALVVSYTAPDNESSSARRGVELRFQRLEMQGFKSFVEKTVIEIGEGLTAVVGPNGCGKSNVCDAVRWVLGEQAPKNMRSKKMEDVIFNGSAERKQHGMSEVSLTVTDLKGVVTSPAFRDFDEVVVTRRLYRSGESEYLINRNPCRLKDIVDLFLDTGVSLDTFSIVEQGKIETLVNARPLDRRVLIEEAAGIMKYKSRRNEALRKLELAQANLLRVADIMREKESRLRSLRRQARKATFHKEYQTEVADLFPKNHGARLPETCGKTLFRRKKRTLASKKKSKRCRRNCLLSKPKGRAGVFYCGSVQRLWWNLANVRRSWRGAWSVWRLESRC